VAIITGSARGIGREIALAYAARGVRVALADVLEGELANTATEIKRAGGVALAMPTDVTNPQQAGALIEGAEHEFGVPQVLVNCAGRLSNIGPLWEADPERWWRDVTVNLRGTFLCCRSVVRRMAERGGGYVLNMAGGGVDDPHAYTSAYACSKVAVLRLTEALAKEAQPLGIRAFAMQPPVVLTEMVRFIADSPEGRKWRPGFRGILKEGPEPMGAIVGLALRLLSGEFDSLSGRYFEAVSDLDATLAQAEAIGRDDRLVLRIRR